MTRTVKKTLVVLFTVVGVVCGGCLILAAIGYVTYGITDQVQGP